MGDGRTKRWGAEIDAELHRALSNTLERGDRTAILREVAEKLAAGEYDGYTVNDIQIAQKREEIEELRGEIRQAQADLEQAESELDGLLREREQIETEADRYDGALWSFEQDFRAGEIGHVTGNEPGTITIADEFGKSVDEVITDLRERNPDVPDKAFEDEDYYALKSTPECVFGGLPPEKAATPMEDRHE